jgi:hypothetical protein
MLEDNSMSADNRNKKLDKLSVISEKKNEYGSSRIKRRGDEELMFS